MLTKKGKVKAHKHKKEEQILLDIEVLILKEDDYFVAYCPSLELSAYAKSIEEAKHSFEREVNVFIDETSKRGTLEKYLIKLGWVLTHKNYIPPCISFNKYIEIMPNVVQTQENYKISIYH